MSELRRTPFYDIQVEHGARFVPFAGYELPVQYTGLVAEHQAVRQRAGLFDVSHMGEFIIEGPAALEAVQWIITNNATKLSDGRALYTVMCREDGGIIDDLIVYRQAEDSYFLCVNGARRAADWQHMTGELKRFDCRARDVSDDWAQMALQGPAADEILTELTDVDAGGMAPFTFVDTTIAGVRGVRVARTGYTGERGVELYCHNDQAATIWRAIEQVGRGKGLLCCGLGARDTLRLEVKYPLYGNDIDEDHNPIEAGLGWIVKLKASDFCGREKLKAVAANGPARTWVGFTMVDRGIPRQGYELHIDGRRVGEVTSGTYSPSLAQPIGCGYVPVEASAPGTAIDVIIRAKPVAARIVETPFYKRDAQ